MMRPCKLQPISQSATVNQCQRFERLQVRNHGFVRQSQITGKRECLATMQMPQGSRPRPVRNARKQARHEAEQSSLVTREC